MSRSENICYLQHHPDWTKPDGTISTDLYFHDNLHLIEKGNKNLSNEIKRAIFEIRNDNDIVGNFQSIFSPRTRWRYSHFSY